MEREKQRINFERKKTWYNFAIWSGLSIGLISAFIAVSNRVDDDQEQGVSLMQLTPVSEMQIDLQFARQDIEDFQPTLSPAPLLEPAPESTPLFMPVDHMNSVLQDIPDSILEELRAIICAYPWPCEEALAVKWCESKNHWDEVGQGKNYGGFQINAIHVNRFPNFWETWMDPATNTLWAFQIWSEQGWKPWGCKPK